MNAQEVAETGQIILSEVGSTLHGTGLDGQEDLDKMGVYIEPPDLVFGPKELEHYIFRTAGEGNRSQPGDIDLTYYSLRKFIKLATSGNPSILLLLFAPANKLYFVNELGHELQSLASAIISQKAGPRFLGYLIAQRQKLEGERGGMPKRPELIEKYGYDTKFAMHALRLGYQGCEILTDGKITLPMEPEVRELLLEVRRGEVDYAEVIEGIDLIQNTLEGMMENTRIRAEPDWKRINDFLYSAYTSTWRDVYGY